MVCQLDGKGIGGIGRHRGLANQCAWVVRLGNACDDVVLMLKVGRNAHAGKVHRVGTAIIRGDDGTWWDSAVTRGNPAQGLLLDGGAGNGSVRGSRSISSSSGG